jgi:RNA polymerase sigma factor (TIGR02999 family)
MTERPEITTLLEEWHRGDRAAFENLSALVYEELRSIAAQQMRRERPDHTLQPTALVNEAFLRLAGAQDVPWQSRSHFYAVCAQVMRRVLVDHARAAARDKRGAGAAHVSLDEAATVVAGKPRSILELDDALQTLQQLDPQKTRIVELRYFTGLSIEETATVLNISAMTVRREWTRAKAWLYRELSGASH